MFSDSLTIPSQSLATKAERGDPVLANNRKGERYWYLLRKMHSESTELSCEQNLGGATPVPLSVWS